MPLYVSSSAAARFSGVMLAWRKRPSVRGLPVATPDEILHVRAYTSDLSPSIFIV